MAVDPKLLYLIGDPIDPIVVWGKLQDTFQKKSWSNKLRLKRKLYSLKLADNGNLQEHLKALVEIFDALAILGDALQDEDRVISLLASLPAKYDTLVTTLETLDKVPNWDAVTERLLHEEGKKKEETGETAFYSRRNVQCYECLAWGHVKRNCPKIFSKNETANFSSLDEDDEIAMAAVNSNRTVKESEQIFLLDSACTQHMARDRNLFASINKSDQKNVFVGDGKLLSVEGEGDILLNVKSNFGYRKCRFKNVLYVPDLTHNLLSISKISASGKNVNFNSKVCQIITGDKTVLFGKKVNNLYLLETGYSKIRMSAITRGNAEVFYEERRNRTKENRVTEVFANCKVLTVKHISYFQSILKKYNRSASCDATGIRVSTAHKTSRYASRQPTD